MPPRNKLAELRYGQRPSGYELRDLRRQVRLARAEWMRVEKLCRIVELWDRASEAIDWATKRKS